MDLTRPSVALCAAGTQAEFEKRLDDARALYRQAWNVATDDYERCVAAHYIAHLESDKLERFRWNELALRHALQADAELVGPLLASLYVNLGQSFEDTGDTVQAEYYFALSRELGITHLRP